MITCRYPTVLTSPVMTTCPARSHVVSLSRGVGQHRAGEPHLAAEHLDVLPVGGRVVADAAGAAGQGRPEGASLPRGASTDPTTWIRCGTAPVTGLVMISIPVMISTSPAAPMPSPPTTSAPVCTRTFAPSGT